MQLIISEFYLAWDMSEILVYASHDEHKYWFVFQYYKKIFVAILLLLAFYLKILSGLTGKKKASI